MLAGAAYWKIGSAAFLLYDFIVGIVLVRRKFSHTLILSYSHTPLSCPFTNVNIYDSMLSDQVMFYCFFFSFCVLFFLHINHNNFALLPYCILYYTIIVPQIICIIIHIINEHNQKAKSPTTTPIIYKKKLKHCFNMHKL